MPAARLSGKKSSAQRGKRASLAVEDLVDRTTREQYRFLDFCRDNQVELTMFTLSGATFIGIVHQHDRGTVLFGGRSENAQRRLIFKDFISMMVPKEPIELFREYRGLGTHRTRREAARNAKKR